jgi:hypothetical protein
MKKLNIALILLLLSVVFLLSSCQNWRVKKGIGSMTVELPANEKFVNATWKDSNLWYITTPADSAFKPTTYTLKEKSKHGLLEGKVIFV